MKKCEKTSDKKDKKSWIIILCLVCAVIVAVVLVSIFTKDNYDGKNGVQNERAALYQNTIYFIENRTLYKANKDGTKKEEIKKLPHQEMGDAGDGYSNIKIYKDRLYAVRWINYSMTTEYYIFSIGLDGTGYKKDIRLPWITGEDGEKYTESIDIFSIKNDYIYYTCSSHDNELNSTSIVYKQKIGTTKRIPMKYKSEETPQLSGQYAYYIKDNEESKTSEIIKMDVETGKETSCYSGKKIELSFNGMAILDKQLIFPQNTNIIITNLEGTESSTEKKVTSSSKEGIFIYNANEKEVIYYNDRVLYKMNLETKKSEELISEKDMQDNFGIQIERVEQLGDTIALNGYLDEDRRKEFTIFVQEKEGVDYRNIINDKIKDIAFNKNKK